MRPFQFVQILITLLAVGCTEPSGTTYFVATNGNDEWSGEIPSVNVDSTDGPFATLERAKTAVRESLVENSDQKVTVSIRGGSYSIDQTIRLTEEDSGTIENPVLWTSYPDESVTLTGTKRIHSYLPVEGSPGASQLPQGAVEHVRVVDLKAHGINDYGDFSDDAGPGLELFVDRVRMRRARYPNSGFLRIASVPQNGDSLIHVGSPTWKREGIAVGRHFGRFKIDDSRPASWADSPDIWMHGYYVWDWRDGFQRVASIDQGSNMVHVEAPFHPYGFSKDQRISFFNVLEELDEPGEWVMDFGRGLLYFWPPEGADEPLVEVSVMEDPVFTLENTSHVRIERLAFSGLRGTAIEIHGGADNGILGNVVRNVGRTAIKVDGGTDHEIRSNDLLDLAGGGIEIAGGDRMTLEPGRHRVANNLIRRFGRVRKTTIPGIQINGVGNTASHNELDDSPDGGIFFRGNDHTIEYNEIHHLARESDDVGAIYIGRDYSMRGNVIRYNYLHHLEKPMHVGVMGVYLDDFMSGVTVHGNVFYKAGRCVFMGGGRRNIIENNLFIGCSPSVFLDARGKVRNTEYFDGRFTALTDRMAAVNATEPPYADRYPELVTLYQDDPAMPKYNVIKKNVSMGGTWLGLYSGLPLGILDMTDNVIGDEIVLQSSEHTAVETEDYRLRTAADSDIASELAATGNQVTAQTPATFDEVQKEFKWLLEIANPFDPTPMGHVGLIADEYRITAP